MGGEGKPVVSSSTHSRIVLLCFIFETGSGCVTQPGLEPYIFLLRLLSAGIIAAHHHGHKSVNVSGHS